MYSKRKMPPSTGPSWDRIGALAQAIKAADAVVVRAGAGLSAAAGFDYAGARFRAHFADFEDKYGFHDMYTGGFYPYPTLGAQWAYWSRYIWINRYTNPPRPVYQALLELVKDKDYFILTTNVDHCFQKAGFDKKRLFYTQGDYGLWQCSRPCHDSTYDNEGAVRSMLEAQGFAPGGAGELPLPAGAAPRMEIPPELVPRCPKCGAPMAMNLHSDDTFVQDGGWYAAAARYQDFLRRHRAGRVLYLELGVGYNTPGIIKYPFWQRTAQNPEAVYACLNLSQAGCPPEIRGQSICLDGDLAALLEKLAGGAPET